MNSKNLSKAINRMLAILLTAAMVAGSFTVPAKADEMSEPAVAESTTDDAADTSDGVAEDVVKETPEPVVENNTSTGEETSEETGEESTAALEITEEGVENPDGEVVNNGIYLDLGLTDAEIAAFSKVYDAKAITAEDIFGSSNSKIKVYTDSTKKSVLGVTPTVTYWKKDGDGWLKLNDVGVAAAGANPIKDANTYKVEVEAYDEVSRGTAEASFEIVISKCNVTNWQFGDGSNTTTDAAYNDMGTLQATFTNQTGYAQIDAGSPKYTVAPSGTYTDEGGNSHNLYSALSVDESQVDVVKFNKPTYGLNITSSNGSKKDLVDEFYTEMLGTTGIGSAKADFTLHEDKAGSGNDLTNATISELSANYFTANDDRPYVEVKLTGLANYEGTLKVPFKIAKANALTNPTDGSTSNTQTILMGINQNVEIDVNSLIPGGAEGERVANSEGNAALEITDVVAGEVTPTSKFFELNQNTEKIYLTINNKGKNNTSIKYGILDAAKNSGTVPLTIKTRNYPDISVVITNYIVDSSDSESDGCTIIPASGALNEMIYDGKPQEVNIQVNDNTHQTGRNSGDIYSSAKIDAYWYKGTGESKVLLKQQNDIDEIASDGENKGKKTLTCPTALDVGEYTLKVVYHDSWNNGANDINSHIAATYTFNVVKNVGGTLGVAAASPFDGKKLTMVPGGAELKAEDLEVTIDAGTVETAADATLTNKDYTVTSYNTNSTFSVAAKVAKIKSEVEGVTWTTGGTEAENFAGDLQIIRTNTGGKFTSYLKSGIEATDLTNNVTKLPVFTNQPYAKISIGGEKGASRFEDVVSNPIYVVYDIEGGSATKNAADTTVSNTWTKTVKTTEREITFDLTHAYTLPGHSDTNEKYADDLITGWKLVDGASNPSGEANGSYYTCSNTKNSFTVKLKSDPTAGNDLVCKVEPIFKEDAYYTVASSEQISLTMNFKTPGNVEISINNNAYTDGEIIYSGAEKVKVSGAGATITTALKSGTTTLDSSNVTSTVYRLASELNVTPIDDVKVEYEGKQGGTAGVYTKTTDGKTLTDNAVTAKDAGTYLIVSTYTEQTNYYAEAKEYYKPFTIEKYNLSAIKASDIGAVSSGEKVEIKLEKDGALNDGELTYKTGTNYQKLIGQKEGTTTGLLNVFTITDITDGLTECVGYDLSFGSMKAPATEGGDYTIPVTIVGKGNFTGSINAGSFTVKPDTSVSPSLVVCKPDTFKYDGEEHIPTMYIQINGNKYLYKGADTQLPDPYMTAEITYANNPAGADDVISAGTITPTLKLGGLFDKSVAGSTWQIEPGDNSVIADPEEINIDLAVGAQNISVPLPTFLLGDEDKTKKYELSYTTPNITLTDLTGTTTLSSSSVASGVLTATTTSGVAAGAKFKITVDAKIENYAKKTITVVFTARAATNEIYIKSPNLAGGSKVYDTKPVSTSDITCTDIVKGGSGSTTSIASSVTSPLGNDIGTLEFEWYKLNTTSNLYEKIDVADTVDRGSYKVVISLDGAGEHWMTPVNINFSRMPFPVSVANVKSVVVDKTGIVYDGTPKMPKFKITLDVVGSARDVVIDNTVREEDIAITKDSGTSDMTTAGTVTYRFAANPTNSNYSGLDNANSKIPDGDNTFTIEKKPLDLSLKDVTVGVDAKNTEDVTYAYMAAEVENELATGHTFDPTKVKVKIIDATDLSGKTIAIPSDLKVFGKTGNYKIMVDSLQEKTVVSGTDDMTANYEISGLSAKGILTVKEPEKITVSSEVKVGDKVVTDKKKLVKPEKAVEVTATVTDETNKKTLVKDTDYSVIVKDKNGKVTSVFALGKYTITIESINTAFTFDPIEMEIEVVDSIPYDVESVEVSPASITLKKSGTTGTIKYSVFGLYEGTSATEPVDEAISIKPATSENFSITDNSDGTITVKALTDTKGITEKFEVSVVSAPDVKPATFTLKTTPSEPGADAPSSDTPGDDAEYTTLDDETREAKSFVEIQANIARLSKSSYTYNGKPCTPNPTVKATVGGKSVTLVKDQDYRVVYEENIDAGIATVKAYGINDYIGTVSYRFLISPKKTSSLKVFTSSATVDEEGICDVDEIGLTVYDGTTPLEMDVDYTPELTLEKGKGVLIIKGQNNYTGEKKVSVPVVNLKNKAGYIAEVTLDEDSFVYDGTKHEPKVTVTAKDAEGEEIAITASDYTVKYSNQINAGVGYVTVTGKGKFTGKVVKSFTISEADKDKKETKLSAGNVKLSKYTYVYNGKLQYPKVTVTDPVNGKKKLTLNKDYRVIYHNNLNVGKACVDIVGIGNYEGQELLGGDDDNTNLQYMITPADISGVKVEKDKSTGKIAKITYKKRVLKEGIDYDAEIVTNKSGKYELHIYGHYNYIENEGDTPANEGNFSSKVKNGVLVPKKQSIKNKTDVADSIGAIDTTITE